MFKGEFSPGFERVVKETMEMFKALEDGIFDQSLTELILSRLRRNALNQFLPVHALATLQKKQGEKQLAASVVTDDVRHICSIRVWKLPTQFHSPVHNCCHSLSHSSFLETVSLFA
jgi:hypothetical protein